MPKLFSTDTEDQVKRLSKQNLTNVEIKKKLAEDEINIHVKAISRMLKNIGIGRQAFSQNKPVPKYKRPPTKINPPLVKKVKNSIRKSTRQLIGK
jgi:arginine repressor